MSEYRKWNPVILEPTAFNGHIQINPIVAQAATYFDKSNQVHKWRLSWSPTNTQSSTITGEGISLDEAFIKLRRGIVRRHDPFHLVVTGQLPVGHNLSPANYREYRELRKFIQER